jgi:hypothetical protein
VYEVYERDHGDHELELPDTVRAEHRDFDHFARAAKDLHLKHG